MMGYGVICCGGCHLRCSCICWKFGEVRVLIGDAFPIPIDGLFMDRGWGDARALIGVRCCGNICTRCCVYGVKLLPGFGTAFVGVCIAFGFNAVRLCGKKEWRLLVAQLGCICRWSGDLRATISVCWCCNRVEVSANRFNMSNATLYVSLSITWSMIFFFSARNVFNWLALRFNFRWKYQATNRFRNTILKNAWKFAPI